MRLVLLVIFLALYATCVSAEADLNCGDPPAVTNERVKGEVQARADAISKLLGALGFGAAYEKSRDDIFSKYDESKAARADQLLYFLLCNTLNESTTLTDEQKVQAIFQMGSVMRGTPTRPGPTSNTPNVVSPPPKWDYYRTGDWPACDAPMGKDRERGIWISPNGHGGLTNIPCKNQSGEVVRPQP